MVIKLTNASEEHKGNDLYLHTAWIVAFFQTATQPGGSLATVVYGGPQGTSWNVEQSPEEIEKMINELGQTK
jgi:hypothetical protein